MTGHRAHMSRQPDPSRAVARAALARLDTAATRITNTRDLAAFTARVRDLQADILDARVFGSGYPDGWLDRAVDALLTDFRLNT